eukprot:3853276-Prymnesium_polylepis.1
MSPRTDAGFAPPSSVGSMSDLRSVTSKKRLSAPGSCFAISSWSHGAVWSHAKWREVRKVAWSSVDLRE